MRTNQIERALISSLFATAILSFSGCSIVFDANITQCRVDSDCPSPSSSGNVELLVCREHVCVRDVSDSGVLSDSGSDATVVSPTLPFVIDSAFVPAGYMGDGTAGALVENGACPARAGDGRGTCHRFVYTKPVAGGQGWGGVYWQSPANNWGSMPGYVIPQGAKSVAFYAWSDQADLEVTFQAGIAAADGFEVHSSGMRVSTTPKRFVLSLGGATYADVVGGFAWTTVQPTGSSHAIFIDDIVWVDESAPVDVTFAVDANGALGGGCAMHLFGSFNAWSIDAITMTGPDASDVYTTTVSLPAGTQIEYLFATKCGSTESVETMTNGAPCTLTTNGFTNRVLNVPTSATTLPTVCRNQCGSCP